jgi:hypothetical protein
MKYDVVLAITIESFIKRVNDKLKEGWTLQGGICMIADTNRRPDFYYQAIVKKDDIT